MRRLHPRIARCFDLYLECRSLDYVHMELTKERGKKVEHKIMPFVNGYHTLPEAGGMLDQPVWTMGMFSIFRAAENIGVKELHSL